jgi:hypothetical protein
MTNASVAIVTCYHFDNSSKNQEAYQRLLGSLSASVQQLSASGTNSRLVLVANGTEDGAMDPGKVIEALETRLPSFRNELVHTCPIKTNGKNTGALNAGIAAALDKIGDVDWIASVQSSAVIQDGWLPEALASGSIDLAIGASFGRILVEEEQSSIWTDGHFLKKGLTYDANNDRRTDEENLCPPGQFPCLSASLFRTSLVKKIWKRYGNFVCEHLCHYADCTDVALRARTVEPSALFKYSETALALKRRPHKDPCNIAASQLLAASLYYPLERRKDQEDLLGTKEKYRLYLSNAKTEADKRSQINYSPSCSKPPSGALLDRVW